MIIDTLLKKIPKCIFSHLAISTRRIINIDPLLIKWNLCQSLHTLWVQLRIDIASTLLRDDNILFYSLLHQNHTMIIDTILKKIPKCIFSHLAISTRCIINIDPILIKWNLCQSLHTLWVQLRIDTASTLLRYDNILFYSLLHQNHTMIIDTILKKIPKCIFNHLAISTCCIINIGPILKKMKSLQIITCTVGPWLLCNILIMWCLNVTKLPQFGT